MMVDLDRVNITPEVYRAWHEKARRAVDKIAAKGTVFRPEEIPDEQAREESDGSLTIFVVLPNGEEVNTRVAPGQWAWRFSEN